MRFTQPGLLLVYQPLHYRRLKLSVLPNQLNFDKSYFYMYIVNMKNLRFEWDNKKDKTNVKKHGISFDEAKSAFFDDHAIQFFDPDHSAEEYRFLLLGMSFKLRILVVCHCFRVSETVIRISSVRKTDHEEEQEYWRSRK